MDRDNPAVNTTAPENTPDGMPCLEHLFRQVIAHGYQQIRHNIDTPGFHFVETVFPRWPEKVRDEIRTWIRDHGNLQTGINYPRPDITLPFVTCVSTSEEEDTQSTVLGNFMGEEFFPESGEADEFTGNALRCVTTVYIAADDPNVVTYLAAIIRFIMQVNSVDMDGRYDIKNLSVSSRDIQWSEQFLPTFCYIKAITLNFQTYFKVLATNKVIRSVTFAGSVNAGDAVPATT